MVLDMADDVKPSDGDFPAEADRITSMEARMEFGLSYPQISGWWKTGAIDYWRQGPYVILSRKQVEERVRYLRTIRHVSPKGSIRQSGETDKPPASSDIDEQGGDSAPR